MSESKSSSSQNSVAEMTTMVDVLLAQSRDLFVGVSYEILIKPRVQGIIKQFLINRDTLGVQSKLANNPSSSFNPKASEVKQLQEEYRVVAETAHNEYHRLKEKYKNRNVDVELIRRQGSLSWTLKPDAVQWPGQKPSTDSTDSQYSSMNVDVKKEPFRLKRFPGRRFRKRTRRDSTYGSQSSRSSDSSDVAEVPQEVDSKEELPEPKQYLTKIRRNPLSYYMEQSSDVAEVPHKSDSEEEMPEAKQNSGNMSGNPLSYKDQSSDDEPSLKA